MGAHMQAQNTAMQKQPEKQLLPQNKAALLARCIDEKLCAAYGSKPHHRIEALKLLSEIEGLLKGKEGGAQSRALELAQGIRERLTAQYGSKPHHCMGAQKMLSELEALLSGKE